MTARTRGVALILSGTAAVWIVLALTVVPRLHLAPVTLGAAAAIIAVQAGALLYALWFSAHPPTRMIGPNRDIEVEFRGARQRALDHLGWLAQLCQILGLLGTVAGFMLEMRALAGVSGSGSMTPLIGQMSRGLATAMTSTFVGVAASIAVSLAQHVLAD